MHDETFLVTKGETHFHTLGPAEEGDEVGDAGVRDYVVARIRAPHTFGNPFGVETRLFTTYTPAFYVGYFKLIAQLMGMSWSPGLFFPTFWVWFRGGWSWAVGA